MSRSKRTITVELPATTALQACHLFELMSRFVDGIWDAFEPELMDEAIREQGEISSEDLASLDDEAR